MRTWPHSGFRVNQSVYLPAGDRAGIERLVGYMTRCPFSLSRLVKVSATGQVVYKAEKDACRLVPGAGRGPLDPAHRRAAGFLWPADPPRQPDVGHLPALPARRQDDDILRHCGLWHVSAPRPPLAGALRIHAARHPDMGRRGVGLPSPPHVDRSLRDRTRVSERLAHVSRSATRCKL